VSGAKERERLRKRAPVETTDPAGLAAYAGALKPLVMNLRALAEDATVLRESEQVHSRGFLRRGMLRSLRELEARIALAEGPHDAEPGDPAGLGGSPAL
jgi:hypothetical protein